MTVFKLYRHSASDQEIEALLNLAAAAGVTKAEISVVQEIGDPIPACDDEVILALLSPSICTDVAFDSNFAKVPLGGRRAICIWGEGAQEFPLPASARKFSYSIVPWDGHKLAAALVNNDATSFEGPAGNPLPPADMDRNVCVVEQKKPK